MESKPFNTKDMDRSYGDSQMTETSVRVQIITLQTTYFFEITFK